jgi:site-specific recombinase
MTAARIAAALGDPAQRSARVARENLVELSVQVMRGQWTAVLGNVGVALPLAALLAWLLLGPLGLPLAGEAKAQSLLHQLDPLGSTFLFAAIAGVCLFLSGVVAGYCDNLCVFHHLPRRLAHMPLLVRAAGRPRAARIGAYVEHHFGALCGNFLFGLMLGGVSLFGQLSGLPLDIRHVAFGSANLGVAGATLWGDVPGTALLIGLIGVAGIGLVNLAVSFSLSLLLALRAQQRPWSLLPEAASAIFAHLRRHPLAPFRLPPTVPAGHAEDELPEPAAKVTLRTPERGAGPTQSASEV